MHRSIGNRSQSAPNAPFGFDRSSQNRSNQADQMTFQYRDSALTACRVGNFTAAMAIVRPQWPLCPWPGQHSELALNYSHLSAQ